MNYNFNADTAILREKNAELKNIASRIEENVSAIIKAAHRVQSGWTGANSDAYVESFNNFKPQMDKQVATMRVTASNIDSIIEIIEENKRNIAAEINKLG